MKEPNKINVLIACEESQRVCIAFRERGFNAFSCDIVQCSGEHPEWHIWGDCLPYLKGNREFYTENGEYHFIEKWDLIIAHPPCTYLTNAGAARLYRIIDGERYVNWNRYQKGVEAKRFFIACLCSNANHVAIENPVPTQIFKLPKYNQIIQPYEYGHNYSKRTCLWLRNLPQLQPTNIVTPKLSYVSGGSKRKDGSPRSNKGETFRDSKTKSKTFPGIAKAMAKQWGDYLLKEGD